MTLIDRLGIYKIIKIINVKCEHCNGALEA